MHQLRRRLIRLYRVVAMLDERLRALPDDTLDRSLLALGRERQAAELLSRILEHHAGTTAAVQARKLIADKKIDI